MYMHIHTYCEHIYMHIHTYCVHICTGATYKELMDYLGRDKQMAQSQLVLLSEELSKLRQERDNAVKQVRACARVCVCVCVCDCVCERV